jgi:hypothetical protein
MKKMTPQEAVGKHEKRLHPGKTPTFKKGGPTTDDRLKYGKNMAKVMSQKTG